VTFALTLLASWIEKEPTTTSTMDEPQRRSEIC
jgi:hypothetical protein